MTRKCAQKHREVFNAFCEGKPVQQRCPKEQTWYDTDDLRWDPDLTYRIKPSPSPKVPLGPEDVPPGTWQRYVEEPAAIYLVLGRQSGGCWLPGHGSKDGRLVFTLWSELAINSEISRDGGKTWQRAEKEAV